METDPASYSPAGRRTHLELVGEALRMLRRDDEVHSAPWWARVVQHQHLRKHVGGKGKIARVETVRVI